MDKEKLTEATKRIAKQCLATISNLTDVLYIHPYMLKVEKTNRRKLRNTFGHMVFDYCIEHHDEPILRRWHPAIWYTRGRGVPVEINVVLDFGTFFSRSNFIFMNADEPVALGAVVLAEFFYRASITCRMRSGYGFSRTTPTSSFLLSQSKTNYGGGL